MKNLKRCHSPVFLIETILIKFEKNLNFITKFKYYFRVTYK